LLRVPILGFASFTNVSGGGPSLLLRALCAAVIGGMTSLPITAGAAVAIGVADALGAWHFHNGDYVNAMLLGVVLIALLVRREKFSRSFETGIGSFRAIQEVRPVPAELARLPEVRWGSRGLQVLVLVAAIAYPIFTRPSQQQLAAVVAIYAMVAVSLVVLTGWSGHISLGHFALVGFGAAACGSLIAVHHVDLMYAVPAGALVGALVAFLIGLPALQIRGPYLAVSTLAFAVSSSFYFLDHKYLSWLVPVATVHRPELWERVSIDSDKQMYYVCLFCLVLVLAFARGLRKSRTGRAIIAVRDNQLAAQSSGMSAVRLQLLAFAISGAIAGFAGSLFVLHQEAFHTGAFNPAESLELFSMVVIGGLGSVPGALLGAVYIKGSEYILAPGYAFLASGLGIVLLLMILPEGLGGALYWLRDEALRRIATRHSLVVPSLTADVRVEEEEARVTLDTALGGLVETGARS
jgi:branched-chain amino acid transport system permease protein